MKICYSTNGFKNHSLIDTFKILKSIGYDGIEIALNHEHFSPSNYLSQSNEINKLSKGLNLPITNIHLGEPNILSNSPHYPSLITTNKIERQKKLELIKIAIELATQVDCKFITITSGLKTEVKNNSESFKLLVENISRAFEFLYPETTLLIEQEPEMFIATTDDLLKLLEATQNKIKINLDLGHLQVTGEDIPNSIKTLFNHISNIHFEDIIGQKHQHLLPGKGEMPFSKIFACLSQLNYKGYFTADLYPFSHMAEDAAKQAYEFTKSFTKPFNA